MKQTNISTFTNMNANATSSASANAKGMNEGLEDIGHDMIFTGF